MDDGNSPFISLKDALKDSKRIKYHNDYLTNLAASIKYYILYYPAVFEPELIWLHTFAAKKSLGFA